MVKERMRNIMNTGKWPFMGGHNAPLDDRIWE
jgi:hypothetical protein